VKEDRACIRCNSATMFDYVAHTGSGTNGGKPKIEKGDKAFQSCACLIFIYNLSRGKYWK